MRHRLSYGYAALIGLGCAMAVHALLGYGVLNTVRLISYEWKRVALALAPSPARAEAYGTTYITAGSAQDLARAEYFFQKVIEQDPKYPNAHLGLSRIAFLTNRLVLSRVLATDEIAIQGDASPPAYYIRALAYAFSGQYKDAARDFDHFIAINKGASTNWAAMNDYAWVLLKDHQASQAALVLAHGVKEFPDNPWLMNSYAAALYETGALDDAQLWAQRAVDRTKDLSEEEFVRAYPGNGYSFAQQGIDQFHAASVANLVKIESAIKNR